MDTLIEYDENNGAGIDINSSPGANKNRVSKKDTQYKGFNLNLNLSITPEGTPIKNVTNISGGGGISKSTSGSPSKEDTSGGVDLILPSIERLLSMEIDDQLRLLALTEMNIVDVKDNIRKLQLKLQQQEQDVMKLRKIIQRSLYRELSTAQNALVTRPDLNRVKGTTSTLTSPKSATTTNNNKSKELQSLIWAKLSNTINMVQQFDDKLLSEFENSLKLEAQPQKKPNDNKTSPIQHKNNFQGNSLRSRSRTYSSSKSKKATTTTTRSPLKPFNTQSKSPVKLIPDNSAIDTENYKLSGFDGAEELFESVQNSIWSFVKTNVLSGYEENLLALVLSRLQNDDDIKKPKRDLQLIEGTPNSVKLDTLTKSIDNLLDITGDNGELEDEVTTVDFSMYSNMRR